MEIWRIPTEIAICTKLKPMCKMIYLYLYNQEKRYEKVRLSTLRKFCNASYQSIYQSKKNLLNAGYIDVDVRQAQLIYKEHSDEIRFPNYIARIEMPWSAKLLYAYLYTQNNPIVESWKVIGKKLNISQQVLTIAKKRLLDEKLIGISQKNYQHKFITFQKKGVTHHEN